MPKIIDGYYMKETSVMRSPKIFSMFGLMLLLIVPGFMNQRQQDPFLSFNLELNSSGSVIVQWKLAANCKYQHMELQRSTDLKSWSSIHSISTPLQTHFDYLDGSAAKGINYYRIKLINEDDEALFSAVTQIELMNTTDCYLWPQPATNVVHVQVPFACGTLEIIDASGRTYQKASVTGSKSEIRIVQHRKEFTSPVSRMITKCGYRNLSNSNE